MMRHTTSDHQVACNCRSVDECHCNSFAWKRALDACVDEFAAEMRIKLYRKFMAGESGWDDPNWKREKVIAALKNHVEKGDMVDVANFAMFAWNKDLDG